jgi:transcriptional regulator
MPGRHRMYVQQKFVETRLEVLHALMKEHPLGAIVTMQQSGIEANHMPFFVDTSAGPHGTLRAHMPRSSRLWQDTTGAEALVIFQGPQTYITPSWYPSKHAHGQAVPTWNYAVVHAYGPLRFIENRDWLLANVTELTNSHEAAQKLPWQVSDAPADYVDKMLAQIIGVEIPIARLVGKVKMSQNRPPADRLGVVAGLSSRESSAAHDVRALVEKYNGEQIQR